MEGRACALPKNFEEEKFMKALIVTIMLAATLGSCSSEQQKSSTNSSLVSPTPEITPQVHITPPVKNANSETTPTTETATTAAPVEFTYTGITPDKESFSYKIKVNTPKPISQVDIGIKYLDAQGQVVSETTRAWQNIVKSKKQPIEQGKTYDVTDDLEPGSIKAECKLKRVFFTDGSNWSAQ
jgi:hypothetical protein